MLNRISSMLDNIADRIEAKGFLKEAEELDRIADLLDSKAFPAFPIPETWTPGEYGNFGELDNNIKEAAGFGGFKEIDTRSNPNLRGMIFDGTGTKRDGTPRRWNHAEATGYYFTAKDGSVMVEVKDSGEIRHLNIATFTGEAASNLAGYKFENGKKIQTHPVSTTPVV